MLLLLLLLFYYDRCYFLKWKIMVIGTWTCNIKIIFEHHNHYSATSAECVLFRVYFKEVIGLHNTPVPSLSFHSHPVPSVPFHSSPLEVGPLNPSKEVWGSAVSSVSRVWAECYHCGVLAAWSRQNWNIFEKFLCFLEKRPLMIKFSKFGFESLHRDTNRRCCVQNSWNTSDVKSVKSCII